jgi:arginine decarboxylase
MHERIIGKEIFFTAGVGKHRHKLQSFEAALRNAGIERFNLVRVSSIRPPRCRIISKAKGLEKLQPGEIVFCVIAESRTNEPNRLASAGIGLAVTSNPDQYGYIAEHHGFGLTHRKCADLVEDMAASMLATTMGHDLDPDRAYDEKQEIYRSRGLEIRTRACVQTAEGDKNGLWTTVLAAAVFI